MYRGRVRLIGAVSGRSAAATSDAKLATALRGLERDAQIVNFRESLGNYRVVRPAPLPAIRHQTGITEHAEVKRKSRLRGVEIVGELADAALAASKNLEDFETGRVGEGVKELSGSSEVGGDGSGHGREYISTFVDASSPDR